MSDQIHVGIIGTSWWVDAMHLQSLKSHPSANIVAICGRNRERTREMALKYDIPDVYTDYKEMIDKGGLDAVVVATPYDLHFPMTMYALDAGLHVLCEKPLALNASEAREMVKKAEAVSVKHMVLFTWRMMPYSQYIKHLLDDGYIGRCFHIHLHFLDGRGRNEEYKWKFDQKRATGTLGGLGSHMIDFAHWAIGDIARVSANLSSFIDRPDVSGKVTKSANDSAVLSIEFKNGAQGVIHVSNVSHVGDRLLEQHFRFHGEAGTLELDVIGDGREVKTTIRGARHTDEHFNILPVPDDYWGDVQQSNFMNEFYEVFSKEAVGPRLFIDSILEDRPISPNFYDGLKVQEVMDAAIESDQKGCWISME